MTSTVYWGSPRQARLEANETLPAKLDLIIDRLALRDRVRDEIVAIKMHTGNNLSYSTAHPVFIRKVVQAVKDGGGKPFVVDLDWDVREAERRGYSTEVLGCPVYPLSGLKDGYHYTHEFPFKNMREWKVGGMIQDATFLVNFAHAKGHPSCGYGAAIKNLALGCMVSETRRSMHDLHHFDQYWFKERCPDPAIRQAILDACPHGALVQDKHDPEEIHLHYDPCNQCGRCLQVAPPGSLKLAPENFWVFQEGCAISTSITLGTFAPEKMVHFNLATHMTPVCDCFGFTSMPILPDAGIFGSNDIVALEQATLDMIGQTKLIEENVPTSMEIWYRDGHPFQTLHGPMKDPYKVVEYAEKLGLGTRQYELVDVFPVEEFPRPSLGYIPAG